jgi:hypothetical protein
MAKAFPKSEFFRYDSRLPAPDLIVDVGGVFSRKKPRPYHRSTFEKLAQPNAQGQYGSDPADKNNQKRVHGFGRHLLSRKVIRLGQYGRLGSATPPF